MRGALERKSPRPAGLWRVDARPRGAFWASRGDRPAFRMGVEAPCPAPPTVTTRDTQHAWVIGRVPPLGGRARARPNLHALKWAPGRLFWSLFEVLRPSIIDSKPLLCRSRSRATRHAPMRRAGRARAAGDRHETALHFFEQPRRERPTIAVSGVKRPQIGARPSKTVAFGEHDP
jgi:hypothetical protein